MISTMILLNIVQRDGRLTKYYWRKFSTLRNRRQELFEKCS